jgi:hypothetical protein
LTKLNRSSQAATKKLKKTELVNSDLKKHLESKERILQGNNEKKKQLQSTIEGLTKLVDFLNQAVQDLCQHPEDVSTYMVKAVTVRSLRYFRVSGTSVCGRTQRIGGLCYCFHLGQGQRIIYGTGLYI